MVAGLNTGILADASGAITVNGGALAGQNITLTFDRYNAGDTVTAPPPDQIQSS